MKTLQILRHSDKDGEHVTQSGLEKLAGLISNPDQITDLFCGSDVMRTAESALAAMVYGGVRPQRLHVANPGLGNATHIERFKKPFFLDARKKLGDNLIAARTVFADDHYERYYPYRDMCSEFRKAVQALMDEIPDGGHGLAFGHSPFIEMAAEAVGLELEKQLGSCEGVTFTFGEVWMEDINVLVPVLAYRPLE
jgi:hypothetical protein